MNKYNIEEIKDKFAQRVLKELQKIDALLKEYNPEYKYHYSSDGDSYQYFTITIGDAYHCVELSEDILYINKVRYDSNFGKNKYLSHERLKISVNYLLQKVKEYSFVSNSKKEFGYEKSKYLSRVFDMNEEDAQKTDADKEPDQKDNKVENSEIDSEKTSSNKQIKTKPLKATEVKSKENANSENKDFV